MKPFLLFFIVACLLPIRAEDLPGAPLTKFAAFMGQKERVITQSSSDVGSLTTKTGMGIRVRILGASAKTSKCYAAQIMYANGGSFFIDLDEIDSLLSGIDALLKASAPAPKFDFFDVDYTTRCGIGFFRQGNSKSNESQEFHIGQPNSYVVLTSDELTQLKVLIQKAQATLKSVQE